MRIGQPQSLGRSVQAIGLEVHVADLRTDRPGLSIRRPLNDAEGRRCPEAIAIGGKPEPRLTEIGGHLGPSPPAGVHQTASGPSRRSMVTNPPDSKGSKSIRSAPSNPAGDQVAGLPGNGIRPAPSTVRRR